MKALMTGLILLISISAQAQKNKIFSLSPMTKDTQKVNGLVVGIGHFQETDIVQTINGVNVDLMVLSPLVSMLTIMYGGVHHYAEGEETKLKSNGLNIGIGGYLISGVEHNGLSISPYNGVKKSNGLGIHPIFHSAETSNGLHIAVLTNVSKYSHGLNLAIHNKHDYMTGIQIGIVNTSTQVRGVQIGLFNRTDAIKGLQLGVINSNGKRTLPFINF